MIEIRLHGRGGQGGVTSAELTALAAIEEGKYAQAFPSFGPERRGAPVMAFVRVSEERIRTREKVYEPDVVLVLDPTILKIVPVTSGLKDTGTLILNTNLPPDEIRKQLNTKVRLALVDATKIALDILRLPITNTTMLGALIKATGIVSPESLEAPLRERFGPIAEKNIQAFKAALEETVIIEE